jgi:hypothetical protein
MNDWSAGYVSDVTYTHGYYTELNPLKIKLAFLNAGLAVPKIGTACELGFGQGLSSNIHAAASVVEWRGNDFNPNQALFANELRNSSGANAVFSDESFEEFSRRTDLPTFDYIGLHGIWTWVSDGNRKIIVDFIKARLKVGGVVYISYNTLPGWAAFAPIRHLLTLHSEIQEPKGTGILDRVANAIGFIEKLVDVKSNFLESNKANNERFEKVKVLSKQYLAHEYFNKDWHPMYFSDVHKWLAAAKMQYACSANYLDHVDIVNLTESQKLLLDDLTDIAVKETVRDFLVNQQFRKDYWVKGKIENNVLEKSDQLRSLRVVLVAIRENVKLKLQGSVGEVEMSESIYNPILDFLADHEIQTLGSIEGAMLEKKVGIGFDQIVQAILVLVGTGNICLAQDDEDIKKSLEKTRRLNLFIVNKTRSSNEISYLASPVLGGGIMVGRFQQLFLLATKLGKGTPTEKAKFLWNLLKIQNQKIIKNELTLETDEEHIKELTHQAEEFEDKFHPLLNALKITI